MQVQQYVLQSLFCWKTFCYNKYNNIRLSVVGMVAILVLLEHLLLHSFPFIILARAWSVAILVLLEHLLLLSGEVLDVTLKACCNPCFAGTPSATNINRNLRRGNPVCCNPCFGGTPSATSLRLLNSASTSGCNPCFGGTPSATLYTVMQFLLPHSSCNPCFGGTPSATSNHREVKQQKTIGCNPCFGGTPSATRNTHHCTGRS